VIQQQQQQQQVVNAREECWATAQGTLKQTDQVQMLLLTMLP
jgi:hypothetical protein